MTKAGERGIYVFCPLVPTLGTGPSTWRSRWSPTVYALSEAPLRLCEMLKYGKPACLFTQDVNTLSILFISSFIELRDNHFAEEESLFRIAA